jgi:hypothetical protein
MDQTAVRLAEIEDDVEAIRAMETYMEHGTMAFVVFGINVASMSAIS